MADKRILVATWPFGASGKEPLRLPAISKGPKQCHRDVRAAIHAPTGGESELVASSTRNHIAVTKALVPPREAVVLRAAPGIRPARPKNSTHRPRKSAPPRRPSNGPPIAVSWRPKKAHPNCPWVSIPKRSGKMAFPAPKNIARSIHTVPAIIPMKVVISIVSDLLYHFHLITVHWIPFGRAKLLLNLLSNAQ